MKKAICILFSLVLLLSLPLTAFAETGEEPAESAEVAAIFAQQEKQPFTTAEGSIRFLDTIWIYLTDGSFVQYAVLDEEPVVFSIGSYRFENGGSFLPVGDEDAGGSLVITRTAKYADGVGLQEYSSEHSYALRDLGFRQLYYAEDGGKTVAAIFYGSGKQSFGDGQMLDTYWIYYSDMSFEQYACLGSDPILFSEGTYRLSDGADFVFDPDTADWGTITITRTMKFQEGVNYAEYESEHTYELGSLGYSRLTPVLNLPDVAPAEEASAEIFPGVEIDYGSSALYTEEEMNAAIEEIRREFDSWEGCELHSVAYAGDEYCNEENIAWMNELEAANDAEETFTQCILFESSFHSPVDGGGAWYADQEYTGWQWWLARPEAGAWKLMTWGFG